MSGPLDIDSTGQPRFHGHDNRECGEHRTVGSHRAWCYDCSEWCYPSNDGACKGCELPALRGEVRQLRQALAAVEKECQRFIGNGPHPMPYTWRNEWRAIGEHFLSVLGAAVTPTPQETEVSDCHNCGMSHARCGAVEFVPCCVMCSHTHRSTPEAATERCKHGRDVAHYVTYGADGVPTSWCPGAAPSGLQRATEQPQ